MDTEENRHLSEKITGTLSEMGIKEVPAGFDARLHDALASAGKPDDAPARVTPVWTKKLVAAAAALAVLTAGVFAGMKVWNSDTRLSEDGYPETLSSADYDRKTASNVQPAAMSDADSAVPGNEFKNEAVYSLRPQSLADAETILTARGYMEAGSYGEDRAECVKAIGKLESDGRDFAVIVYNSEGECDIIFGEYPPEVPTGSGFRLYSK